MNMVEICKEKVNKTLKLSKEHKQTMGGNR